MAEELPLYLNRESRTEKKLIARFRCGNEEMDEQKKECSL